MAVTVKGITLWRGQVTDRSGALADTLGPLAASKADLRVVMGCRVPGERVHAVIEVAPVTGKARMRAARQSGLASTDTPTLFVEGDNRPGLGHVMTRAIADAGIPLAFLVTLVSGRRYSAVIGFDSAADATRASTLIRKAARRPQK